VDVEALKQEVCKHLRVAINNNFGAKVCGTIDYLHTQGHLKTRKEGE